MKEIDEKTSAETFKILLKALLTATAIAVFSLFVPFWVPIPKPLPSWLIGVITHSSMLTCSLVLAYYLTGGRLQQHGYTWGTFRWRTTLLLWTLPMALFSTVGFFASSMEGTVPQTSLLLHFRTILCIWIYASVCEETLTRGLLQSMLAPLRSRGFTLMGRWFLSLPVLVSGFFFGLMHVVAIPMMGPMVVVFTSFAGCVAAYYRERTGSIVPAILIHAFFNIGGMLPFWLLTALFHQ